MLDDINSKKQGQLMVDDWMKQNGKKQGQRVLDDWMIHTVRNRANLCWRIGWSTMVRNMANVCWMIGRYTRVRNRSNLCWMTGWYTTVRNRACTLGRTLWHVSNITYPRPRRSTSSFLAQVFKSLLEWEGLYMWHSVVICTKREAQGQSQSCFAVIWYRVYRIKLDSVL